ncbi:GNAT family N-acetyltransferase [Winogradskyella alexanderae]|uniref:GNAT family N-acetyltransferase n=1 Tax=Winogradskyella alexanderae TaxID=2877123 RepID=A0ABS7XTD6_9FLAO|nr:GNAT family N-acetyltransferase [Winogradskyella alexanderae]MCA0133050.1 GNAT family N-acetyltransferase [Winogradskyella alexanderae]
MVSLKGDNIFLRALEPEDLEFVHSIENDINFWELSDTKQPYSRFIIKEYLKNATQDIFEAKQLRLAICDNRNSEVIGLIDLYDFNPIHKRAGLGILIKEESNRGKGVGKEALNLLLDYAFKILNLHQVYASISEMNEASLNLFQKTGFKKIGLKKDWTYDGKTYRNEFILQRINI